MNNLSIKYIDSLTLDIYLKKEIIQNVNFKDKDSIEKYLKKLFQKLKEKYDLIIEGYYQVKIYIDEYYGIIIHLEKENIDYLDYFKNQVDMRIIVENINFYYLVNDIPNDIIKKVDIINKNNNVYLKIKNELTKLEMMILLENSSIVYDI